jgi:hypothetical protein
VVTRQTRKKERVPGPSALRRLGATVVLTVSLFGLIPGAGAATQTVKEEGLAATFTYHGTSPLSQNPHLEITQDGKVVFDQPVSSLWCGKECSPNVIAGARNVVHIVRLQRLGPPSVVLDLYSGGAHCCAIEQVYSFEANSARIHKTEHDFGDPGVQLVKLGAGGSYDFLSANDVFAYAFTDFAASGLPIEILSFSGDAFHNVTRSFPGLIAKDAKQWMSAFDQQASSHYQDSVGVVAAWAADEDMLGHSASVARFLAHQAQAGHLNSALSPVTSSGRKYVVALQKFLRQNGYLN